MKQIYWKNSFSDNALQLKYFLNEEVARLKEQLQGSIKTEEISSDPEMFQKANKVIDRLKSYSIKEISEDVILTVLKTQALVKEINTDGNND